MARLNRSIIFQYSTGLLVILSNHRIWIPYLQILHLGALIVMLCLLVLWLA
jgi:hypothetical protein